MGNFMIINAKETFEKNCNKYRFFCVGHNNCVKMFMIRGVT